MPMPDSSDAEIGRYTGTLACAEAGSKGYADGNSDLMLTISSTQYDPYLVTKRWISCVLSRRFVGLKTSNPTTVC
jgi:hypothetical protein